MAYMQELVDSSPTLHLDANQCFEVKYGLMLNLIILSMSSCSY